jgi:hypothetical protein
MGKDSLPKELPPDASDSDAHGGSESGNSPEAETSSEMTKRADKLKPVDRRSGFVALKSIVTPMREEAGSETLG